MKLDDLDLIGLLAFLFIVTIAIVCVVVAHETKRNRRELPSPHQDSRSWSINYMTDFKRWTR